jgi:hypothetical protein
VAFFAGLGVSLLLGGLFVTGLMIVLPGQVGLFDVSRLEAWGSPEGMVFGFFALMGLALAIVGAFCCRRAYIMFKTSGHSDKAGSSHD